MSQPNPKKTCRTLLIVEDDDDVRVSLKEVLEDAGHRVFDAATGADAVVQATRIKPEIGLIDLGLPDLDGFEVAERIRAGGIPMYLVALSGYGSPEDKRHARDAGFDRYMVKPVDLEALKKVLTEAT